jgi:uncharacterized protein YdeI (YjbR/CyaY-like superfamily)
MKSEPIYFATAAQFRKWLETNADTAAELAVGFHKRSTGKPSLTWPQAVDEALCFGWIDGVRRRVNDERYQIRFTPRKQGSTWSAVNIGRFVALQAEGRITAAGVAAFERRSEKKSKTYSYEQAASSELSADETKAFKRQKKAWEFFKGLAPSYRKKLIWWIVSAKQAATRETRFAKVLEACAEGRKL